MTDEVLADIVQDAVRRARRSRHGTGRQIEVDVPTYLPLIFADPNQIGRVLDNLLSNALKYSDGDVTIRSLIADDGGCILTEVSDSGRGIPQNQQQEIFDKFYRLRQTGQRGREGAGLGLAICKSIISSHGGDIGVESTWRRGSTFWFKLPVETTED